MHKNPIRKQHFGSYLWTDTIREADFFYEGFRQIEADGLKNQDGVLEADVTSD